MTPPGERPREPRKGDRFNFLKNPFGSRTTSHLTLAGGLGTSSQAAHDVAISSSPAENTARSEIQSNQDNIDAGTGGSLRQDLSRRAIRFPWSGPKRSQGEGEGEGEAQRTTAHVKNPIQDHGAMVVEGDPSDLSSATQSNIAAAATSHADNDPQESAAQVEHQPAERASEIYKEIKITLQKVVGVFPGPPFEERRCSTVVHLRYGRCKYFL
ncbi:hypothetical protein H1R20_g6613, partial [Candolleomyces eurysporus]